MGHLNSSVDCSNLIDSLDLGTKTTVDAEDFAIDDSSNGQIVEHLGAIFPGVRISVLSVDLIIKSIDSCDLPGLKIIYLDS
jgi:hypothetical protein